MPTTQKNIWNESPDSDLATLQDGVELKITVDGKDPQFKTIDTPFGPKLEINISDPYPGTFRTGSRWLADKLQFDINEGHRTFVMIREGFKIRYRLDE